MRVLVCGGRAYKRVVELRRALDALHEEVGITVLIEGEADGADKMAADWAIDRGIWVEPYPILPGEGGYTRNRRMLTLGVPELVVHFPGGNGTRHMRDIARDAGVRTHGGLAGPLVKPVTLV